MRHTFRGLSLVAMTVLLCLRTVLMCGPVDPGDPWVLAIVNKGTLGPTAGKYDIVGGSFTVPFTYQTATGFASGSVAVSLLDLTSIFRNYKDFGCDVPDPCDAKDEMRFGGPLQYAQIRDGDFLFSQLWWLNGEAEGFANLDRIVCPTCPAIGLEYIRGRWSLRNKAVPAPEPSAVSLFALGILWVFAVRKTVEVPTNVFDPAPYGYTKMGQ